jgi:hypothetical protein
VTFTTDAEDGVDYQGGGPAFGGGRGRGNLLLGLRTAGPSSRRARRNASTIRVPVNGHRTASRHAGRRLPPMGDRGGNGLGAMIAGAGGTFVLAALVFRGFASRQCLTRSTKTPTSVPSSKRSTPRLVTASAVLIHDQADRDARLLSATPLPRRTWRRLGRHHRHADNASGALGGKRYGCSARSSLPSNVRRAGRAGERRGTRPLFAPPVTLGPPPSRLRSAS